jgi:hypothetical protein
MEGDMTTPIPGYGQSIPGNLTLGHIAWYSIAKPRLTSDNLIELIANLGLDPAIIPKPPRPGDAFKRACRYSERKGLPIPYSDNMANFLIRPVTQTLEDIERHVVIEVVDSDGRKLEYHDVAHLTFDRKKNSLKVAQKSVSDLIDPLTNDTLQSFAVHLKDATKYIDAQVIRRMIREQLDLMSAIAVRRQGSVYFIPFKSVKLTEALEQFTTYCGPGSAFHALPLIDDTKQREMVKAAFEDEVHEGATQLITELGQLQGAKTEITANAWTVYKEKFNTLKAQMGEYQTLVDMELLKADSEMDALEHQLADFITSGLIKT